MAGATIGLSIAAPLGPTSMLCVQRTLGYGFYAGLASGLGIATVHLAYGILASLSASTLQIMSQHSPIFPVVASLILMGFALRVVRSEVVLDAAIGRRSALGSAYCGAIGFGFLNPFTPILFAAASPNLVAHDAVSTAFLIVGVFVGSMTWWSILLSGVSCFRRSLTPRLLTIGNRVTGVFLGAMAITTLARVCFAAS
jgi:threonine/homoserine/homoserine lactone efflux protein